VTPIEHDDLWNRVAAAQSRNGPFRLTADEFEWVKDQAVQIHDPEALAKALVDGPVAFTIGGCPIEVVEAGQ
jgi:hypothetical protein